jgi:hypothetical protein
MNKPALQGRECTSQADNPQTALWFRSIITSEFSLRRLPSWRRQATGPVVTDVCQAGTGAASSKPQSQVDPDPLRYLGRSDRFGGDEPTVRKRLFGRAIHFGDLVPMKEPLDVVVIDHLEKRLANQSTSQLIEIVGFNSPLRCRVSGLSAWWCWLKPDVQIRALSSTPHRHPWEVVPWRLRGLADHYDS